MEWTEKGPVEDPVFAGSRTSAACSRALQSRGRARSMVCLVGSDRAVPQGKRTSAASVTFHPREAVRRDSIKTHGFDQVSTASLKRLILRNS